MSRKLKLALHQAAVLQSVPSKPESKYAERMDDPKPLDTRLHPYRPPMSLKEALLTNARWISLDEAIRQKERARQVLIDRLEEESFGQVFGFDDSSYHGKGRWVDGEYVEDTL